MSKGPPVLRIGHMPYANSLVYYSKMPRDQVELITLPPRNMADAMKRGLLDAGPLPTYEVLKMGDAVTPLLDFGVATIRCAQSVLLFSDFCTHELSGKSIEVTPDTSTSVQLLRILMADLWKVSDVNLVAPDDSHDAELLIGDAALENVTDVAWDKEYHRHVYDLGEEWHKLTGLPFVFARWVARRDADVDRIASILKQSYERWNDHVSCVMMSDDPYEGLGEYDDLINGYTGYDVMNYVDGFTYRLDEDEFKAIEEFRSRLAKLPHWEPPVMPYKSES